MECALGHGVEGVGNGHEDGVGRVRHDLVDDAGDDLHVGEEQVVAGHARLAGDAGSDDDHVRACGLLVGVGPYNRGVAAGDGARFEDVERLALREAIDDVHEDDIGVTLVEDSLGGSRSDVPCPDYRYLAACHSITPPVLVV